MGSILQQRMERVSIGDREWKKRAPRSNNRPAVVGIKMGRRQSQSPIQSQENNHEKRPQRRKHKPNTSSTKWSVSQHSAPGSSMCPSVPPEEHTMKLKVSSTAEHRKHKHSGLRSGKRRSAFLCHSLPRSSPDQQEELSHKQESGDNRSPPQQDSDTDLSESERLPVSSSPIPPRLDLSPEVIEDEDLNSDSLRVKGRGRGGLDFPDFLPPPFNSWNLSQLAVFYNTDGRGTLRTRPVGPLESYLERLLQLEWDQIQTVQEEHGTQEVSGGMPSCQKSTAAAPSRLSSPKCILQCQRAFPLTFLSSLTSHSTLLSGCACSFCRICYSTCNALCCHSIRSHSHQSRWSPMLDRSRGPTPLPKRSYSESRVHSADRMLRTQMLGSPMRTNSYLSRMQASGNIRNPIQSAPENSHSSVKGCSDQAGRGDRSNCTVGVLRKRSGSEQREGGGEGHLNGSETSRSSSECRKGRARWGRAVKCTEQEIKPDAVTAIIDNLPGSKYPPIQRPNTSKQVEFVP